MGLGLCWSKQVGAETFIAMALVSSSLFSVSHSSCLKGTEIERSGRQAAGVVLPEARKMTRQFLLFGFVLSS